MTENGQNKINSLMKEFFLMFLLMTIGILLIKNYIPLELYSMLPIALLALTTMDLIRIGCISFFDKDLLELIIGVDDK